MVFFRKTILTSSSFRVQDSQERWKQTISCELQAEPFDEFIERFFFKRTSLLEVSNNIPKDLLNFLKSEIVVFSLK